LKLCGTYLNRARVVILFPFIPILFLNLNAQWILSSVGVDEEAARAAGQYVSYMVPALFMYAQFDAIRQFLNALGITRVTMYVQIVTTIAHYFWTDFFVNHLKYGLFGTACSMMIAESTNFFLIMIVASTQKQIKEAWFMPDRTAFMGLWDYLKIGIPTLLMTSLEYWAFCLLTILASIHSTELVAAHVVS
jgi:multidrug resistance protein, MATE family